MGGNPGFQEEERRVLEVYSQRRENQSGRVYDPLTPTGLWSHVEADRHLLWGLGQLQGSLEALGKQCILEVGCGVGSHLLRLLSLGLTPSQLHGIDLLSDRIHEARSMHEQIDFRVGNAAELPWASASMDVVLQSTCLSSVLDPKVREAIAQEMTRVLKPGGGIISYDFVWNPINRDTVGIGKAELKRLFPGARIDSRRVFLAPPIARRLLPRFRLFATILDAVPWLCFHRVAVIRPIVS